MPSVAVLVSIAYVPILPSGSEVGRWAAIILGAAILVWGKLHRPPWVLLAFLAACSITVFWSIDTFATAAGIIKLVALGIIMCVPVKIEQVMGALAAGLAVSSALAVYQFSLGAGEFSSGLFAGKNQAVEIAFPVLVWALLSSRFYISLVVFPLVFLPGAKEVVVMAVASGAVILWHFRPHITAVVVTLAVGVMLLVAAMSDAAHTLGERLIMWQDSWTAFIAQSWGWGYGTFPWLFPNYEYAHNEFVQQLVETGPLGVLALIVLFISAMRVSSGVAERAALAAIIASSLLWWPLHAPASVFLTAVLLGNLLFVCRYEPDRRVAGITGFTHCWPDAYRTLRMACGRFLMVPLRFSSAAYSRAISAGVQSARALALVAAASVAAPLSAYAQSSPLHYLSAANNNSTLVFAGAAVLGSLSAINTNSTVYYLKLYDKATAPTCGTDIPKWTIPLLTGAPPPPAPNILFVLGFGFCITAGIADNDNTAAATGITINFGLSRR